MTIQLINKDLEEYAEFMSSPPSDLLDSIEYYTEENVPLPVMLSGYIQGRALSMFSHMIQPRYVLEVGTYTGYSAICLAEGLQKDGELFTIDKNDDIEDVTQNFISKSPQADQIKCLHGDASEIIPELKYPWDIVFLDADKKNYSTYYDMVIDQMPIGSYIFADNVLYNGEVLDENRKRNAKAIHEFNEKIKDDHRVTQILLPFRDGLTIIRKTKN